MVYGIKGMNMSRNDKMHITQTINIAGKDHCIYCGKESRHYHDFVYHYGIDTHFYNCDCEIANDESKMRKEQNEKLISQLQYEYELEALKRKHGIK